MSTDSYRRSETAVILRRAGACAEVVAWARDYPDLQDAWDACRRGEQMLRYVAHVAHDEAALLAVITTDIIAMCELQPWERRSLIAAMLDAIQAAEMCDDHARKVLRAAVQDAVRVLATAAESCDDPTLLARIADRVRGVLPVVPEPEPRKREGQGHG